MLKNIIAKGEYGTIHLNNNKNTIIKQVELFYIYDIEYNTTNKIKTENKYFILNDTIKEICILSQVPNHYIPKLYNCTTTPLDYNFYIEMENCGITLEEYYKSLNPEKKKIMFPIIFYKLVSAFYQLSLSNIMHVDIKTNNICVKIINQNISENTDNIEIKIIDFGISSFKINNKYSYVLGNTLTKPPESKSGHLFENSTTWSIFILLLDLFSLETKYLVEIINTYKTHYLYTTSSNFLTDIEAVIKFKIKIQDDINYKTKLSNILTDINNNLSIFSEYYKVFKKMAYRNPKDRISLKELYEHQIFNTFADNEVFPIISKQLFNNNIICEKYPIHKYARKLEIINMNNYIQKFTFLKSYHKILAIATVLFDKFMNNYNPENTILLTDIIALSCSIISTSLFSDIEVDIKSMLFDMQNIYCYNDLKNCIYNIIISINGILYFPTFTDNLENIDENKLLDTLIENTPPYNNKILLDYYNSKSGL